MRQESLKKIQTFSKKLGKSEKICDIEKLKTVSLPPKTINYPFIRSYTGVLTAKRQKIDKNLEKFESKL